MSCAASVSAMKVNDVSAGRPLGGHAARTGWCRTSPSSLLSTSVLLRLKKVGNEVFLSFNGLALPEAVRDPWAWARQSGERERHGLKTPARLRCRRVVREAAVFEGSQQVLSRVVGRGGDKERIRVERHICRKLPLMSALRDWLAVDQNRFPETLSLHTTLPYTAIDRCHYLARAGS